MVDISLQQILTGTRLNVISQHLIDIAFNPNSTAYELFQVVVFFAIIWFIIFYILKAIIRPLGKQKLIVYNGGLILAFCVLILKPVMNVYSLGRGLSLLVHMIWFCNSTNPLPPSLLGYTCDHCVELTSDSLST